MVQGVLFRISFVGSSGLRIIKKVKLQTLRRQYELLSMNDVAVEIEESKDLDLMSVEELQNYLEAHEQRINERRNTEKAQE